MKSVNAFIGFFLLGVLLLAGAVLLLRLDRSEVSTAVLGYFLLAPAFLARTWSSAHENARRMDERSLDSQAWPPRPSLPEPRPNAADVMFPQRVAFALVVSFLGLICRGFAFEALRRIRPPAPIHDMNFICLILVALLSFLVGFAISYIVPARYLK